MTTLGDIVLVHFEGEPAFFARVEDIDSDVKPGWFRVRLQVLTVPVQDITWILREEYIAGAPFTMGGRAMRLSKVERLAPAGPEPAGGAPENGGKVVSLKDRRK